MNINKPINTTNINKTTNSLPSSVLNIVYGWGWGFAPTFLTSPTVSNGGGEETLRKKKRNFRFGQNTITVIVDIDWTLPNFLAHYVKAILYI